MKSVIDLKLGFRDAENYHRRENREFFNKIFVRTPELERLCEPGIFFLIGEKGTGKTAYATYMSNSSYKENVSCVKNIRETEYLKFIQIKNEKNLNLSDYMSIWKVIISLLLAQQIRDSENNLIAKARICN